jgi:hypothetical protein
MPSVTTARPLRPTDLPALATSWAGGRLPVGHGLSARRNQARTWDRLGVEDGGIHFLERALEQGLPLARRRHTWVAVRGLSVRGVASARPRGQHIAWEVDYLSAAVEDEAAGTSLLEELCRSLGEERVEKVFLRLDSDSPLLEASHRAGFFPCCREHLLRIDGPPPPKAEPAPLCQRAAADAYPLFQLYNAAVPGTTRSHQAVTFREWLAAQEKGRCQQLVLPGDGHLLAWLRLLRSGRGGTFSLLHHPSEGRAIDGLLAAAFERLAGGRPIFALVPEYDETLARRLEELGFTMSGEYVLLAKRLLRPVEEAVPVREAAEQAYPVS